MYSIHPTSLAQHCCKSFWNLLRHNEQTKCLQLCEQHLYLNRLEVMLMGVLYWSDMNACSMAKTNYNPVYLL